MKKRILNLVEMWRQRGSNDNQSIQFGDVGSDVGRCCNGDCSQGRTCPKRKEIKMNKDKDKWIKLACAVGLAFAVGVNIGQFLLKKNITDDCRILRATRFGEVYISCGTAQKL